MSSGVIGLDGYEGEGSRWGKNRTPGQYPWSSTQRVRCRRAGTRLDGQKERLLARSLAPRLPALVGSEDIREEDRARIASVAASLIALGPIEVFLAVLGSILVLDILAVLTRGRRLRSLDATNQAWVIDAAFRSRFWLVRGASVLAALPAKVAFYNQDARCRLLGVDRDELSREAALHPVSRHAGL